MCSFFSLLQITRADITGAVHRIHSWLRPGGYLVLGTDHRGRIHRAAQRDLRLPARLRRE
ncbi:hypothetical protein D5S17_19635 [Pseudonocardiaceae bacterium YIM PH 21723]|nr:hypothetical protein D5S17_19635 [Pseudonocardiaceae bacterium YIM PH 21723]